MIPLLTLELILDYFHCKKGRVFCFEPVNDNYELLLENIKLNNITNIIPFNCAVSQNSSKVKIFLNDDQSSHSMFIPNSESIEVPSISIHDIFKENEIKKCDLLKLDCEGAEYDIIKSIKQEFFGFINKIAIEISSEVIKNTLKYQVNTSNISAIVEEISKVKLKKYL